MSLSDLSEFESEWVDPISTNYHGYDVFQLPPPGQGFATLEMLNIAEGSSKSQLFKAKAFLKKLIEGNLISTPC